LANPNNLKQVQSIQSIGTRKEPLVSVIITTKNEEKNIEKCIQSVQKQSYKNIELILVDNFSEDKTIEIAQKYAVKIFSKGNERSAQRNYGANVATGKYLIYLDADMILSRDVLSECVQCCEQTHSIASYIPERIVGHGFWIKVRDFERSFYTGTVIDAVRFIRRDLFLQVGGFDENLIGPEDWDFDRKIRKIGRTGITRVPLYHNEGRFNIKRYLKKKGYYTDGIQKYIKKWGPVDLVTIKQTGLWYRLIGVFVEKGKWKKLIQHPIFMVAMYYLRIRVAIEYYFQTSKAFGQNSFSSKGC
jgi:glycosyltransferase involved in cell wall biosynthesis